MKWTPKRLVALFAIGLIAWGASSATGDEQGTTAPPEVAPQTLDATRPSPDTTTEAPDAEPTTVAVLDTPNRLAQRITGRLAD